MPTTNLPRRTWQKHSVDILNFLGRYWSVQNTLGTLEPKKTYSWLRNTRLQKRLGGTSYKSKLKELGRNSSNPCLLTIFYRNKITAVLKNCIIPTGVYSKEKRGSDFKYAKNNEIINIFGTGNKIYITRSSIASTKSYLSSCLNAFVILFLRINLQMSNRSTNDCKITKNRCTTELPFICSPKVFRAAIVSTLSQLKAMPPVLLAYW